MSNKIYPIGIQNFEKIRKDGYFYVDKTAIIYRMVKTGSYYLLSRPRRFGNYRLGFPNREVEEGFIRYLMPYYTNVTKGDTNFEIQKFVHEVEVGNPEAFFLRMQSFFADTPYELIRNLELHYQNVLFIVFRLVGLYVQAEYHTSEGRIDMVLKTDRFIYVMEFKFDDSAEKALQQIEEKHYARPFEADKRKVFKIGVNFSSKTRNIEQWIIE